MKWYVEVRLESTHPMIVEAEDEEEAMQKAMDDLDIENVQFKIRVDKVERD